MQLFKVSCHNLTFNNPIILIQNKSNTQNNESRRNKSLITESRIPNPELTNHESRINESPLHLFSNKFYNQRHPISHRNLHGINLNIRGHRGFVGCVYPGEILYFPGPRLCV